MTNIEGLEGAIKAIHAAPQMVVIEFAGAGARALAWLHEVGGSSRTILEATDRYAAASLVNSVGFEPGRFTSPRIARAMATTAYIRAGRLAGHAVPVAGIGCTATIATDRIKRGNHRACVAVCDAQGVTTYVLTLAKGRRTRLEEEYLISLLILKAVAKVCGVAGLPAPRLFEQEELLEQFKPVSLPARLLTGDFNWVAISPSGQMTPGQTWPNIAFLSGAFNPLHDAHRQMARIATEILKQDVHFELPLFNADKSPLDLAEVQRRTVQFANFATLILTRVPLFSQKAQLFPHSVFVIGIDTVARLVQLRFYDNDPAKMRAAFNAVRAAGCRFLVAGRVHGYRFLTLRDVKLPAGYRELFEEIPEDRFRMDISSTAIRKRSKN